MKVKELIEALQKVDNQDAIVIFMDGELNKYEIDVKELEVWKTSMSGWACTWDETTKTHYKGEISVVNLSY
jgi:hypothetical protein